jgi:hypothetical protein
VVSPGPNPLRAKTLPIVPVLIATPVVVGCPPTTKPTIQIPVGLLGEVRRERDDQRMTSSPVPQPEQSPPPMKVLSGRTLATAVGGVLLVVGGLLTLLWLTVDTPRRGRGVLRTGRRGGVLRFTAIEPPRCGTIFRGWVVPDGVGVWRAGIGRQVPPCAEGVDSARLPGMRSAAAGSCVES